MNRGRGRNISGSGYSSLRGRSPLSGGYSANRLSPVGPYGASSSGGSGDPGGHDNPQQRSQGGTPNWFDHTPTSHHAYQPISPSPGQEAVGRISKLSEGSVASDLSYPAAQADSKDIDLGVSKIHIGETPNKGAGDNSMLQDKAQLLANSETKDKDGNSRDPGQLELVKSFDICPPKTGSPVMLKPSLLAKNREKRNEIKRSMEGENGSILRPGMVLLKSYISSRDQVRIVKLCRDLGKGTGGFYQPGYRDGAKLHLKMMCLGKNWDPQTSEYGDIRLIDGTRPPSIPDLFHQLVEKAIQDSHALIAKEFRASKVQEILPWMKPNICIVNFYSESGRLGLHQDRDESQDSLRNGLPVVSFSIGDSAEFLYGDEREADKAEKVILESGDLLIFGGKSRHIFHGVSAIRPNTAPKSLLEETNLLNGRLNLTFREY